MKLYNLNFKTTALLLSSLFVLFFASCKDNIASETSPGNSRLIWINSAASSSAIDLYAIGNKLNSVPLAYGNSTAYQNLASGVRAVQVKSNLSNKLLATNTIHVQRDSSYTFFVYESNNAVNTVITQDDLSLPSFGNAKVKFANMSVGLSAADLVVSNGPTVASSVSFGTIGSYTELKAGTYNLILRVHGSNTILLSIPNVRLDNGKIYTIWSSGKVDSKLPAALSVQTIMQ